MVEILLPGCGGMLPLPNRWLSCCWIEYMGKVVLIDCGEGTQIALKKAGRKLSRLEMLLITHFHADHIAGLPGLLLSLGNYGKTSPLIIAGPRRIAEIARSLLVIAPVLPFPVEYIVLDKNNIGFEASGFNISSLPLRHGMTCLGYSIVIKRKPVFNPEKADKLGIPKQMYKVLHDGNTVTHEGRTITPDMVLDGVRKNYKISFITDTLYFEGIAEFAADSDVLVCEGMYGDEEMRGKLAEKGHMVFSDSARIARDGNVGKLILTHLSPAFLNPFDYIDKAREVFPETEVGYDGIMVTI